jgi:hypothetical protein
MRRGRRNGRDQLMVARATSKSSWWCTLTAMAEKASWYAQESFFRESLADLQLVLGNELEYHLQRTAILTIRPDGIAGRRVEAVVRFIVEHGFRIVHVEHVRYTPITARELWRYQWNRATLDRLILLDLICRQGPGLILVLRDDIDQHGVPATVRLWSLKGSAVAEKRDGRKLRDVCMAPNRVLTLLHAADEPIDLVREMGVLLSTFRRLEWAKIFACVKHDPHAEAIKAMAMARSLYASTTAVDFNADAALARMWAAVADSAPDAQPIDLRAKLLHELSQVSTGHYFRLRAWLIAAEDVLESFDPWDIITAASFAIEHNIPGATSMVPGDVAARWYDGEGRLARRGSDSRLVAHT